MVLFHTKTWSLLKWNCSSLQKLFFTQTPTTNYYLLLAMAKLAIWNITLKWGHCSIWRPCWPYWELTAIIFSQWPSPKALPLTKWLQFTFFLHQTEQWKDNPQLFLPIILVPSRAFIAITTSWYFTPYKIISRPVLKHCHGKSYTMQGKMP